MPLRGEGGLGLEPIFGDESVGETTAGELIEMARLRTTVEICFMRW
jgi:hypothetical protein